MPDEPPFVPVKLYQHEIAVENPLVSSFHSWDQESGRILRTPFGTVTLTPVVGQWPPLYVQTITDLDLDGIMGEAVVIMRPLEGSAFIAVFFRDLISLTPDLMQIIALAPNVEPDGFTIGDLNEDGAPDVSVWDSTANRRIILVNDGAGQFSIAQPGDHDADDDTDLADHTALAACYAGPNIKPQAPDYSPQQCLFWFDLDADDDVDLRDAGHFAQVFTGAF